MDAEQIAEGRRRWQERYDAARKSERDYTTLSGVEVEPLYGPAEADADARFERIGWPGEYPFTRGIHPTGYRGKLWTMRQFAGFSSPENTNKRFKYLLEHGQTGLSVAYDLPALMGLDADSPLAEGEVGKCGVAVSSLADFEVLFNGIPLDRVWAAVHRSNMAKVDPATGKVIKRADGKVLKPEGWTPPDIPAALAIED